MNYIEQKLDSILRKVETLKALNQKLNAENEELINQLLVQKERMEECEKRIDELENKSLNLQYSSSMKKEDKQQLKKVINELIKEIDKGLELLKS